MAAAMFMNSNSLPIALMQSLVATVPDLKWDEDDDKNTMLGRALTYLVMYSTLGMMVSLSTSRKSREFTNDALATMELWSTPAFKSRPRDDRNRSKRTHSAPG